MDRSTDELFLDDTQWSPIVFGALATMENEIETLRRREATQAEALARLTEQVEQAGRMQRRLLSSCIPSVDGAQLHAFYRSAEAVGGDFYDVVRIDQTHVAMVMADATGHGFAAGLLSTLVKGALRAQRGVRPARSAPDPADVLEALNHELLHCSLSECEFVTAVYAVYDESSRVLRWSRGGAPYPVVIRAGHTPRPCRSDGLALGIHENARFETAGLQLEPNETLVFHTDGLDALLWGRGLATGTFDESRAAWFDELGRVGAAAQFNALGDRLARLHSTDWHVDDVTVVALHVGQ